MISLETILSELSWKNKDKKIIYPDIVWETIFDAISQLFSSGENPVICGKKTELVPYQELISRGLEYFQVPEGDQNEVFAAQKLASWVVDWFLGGNITTTSDIVRALIKNVGSKDGISRISSHFLFGKDNDTFLFADSGIQVDPTAEQLAEIGLLTVQQALIYGVHPRVALLSFSTAGSGGDHPKALKMREATELLRKLLQENNLAHIPVEWEIQFDAALIPEIGKKKNSNTTLTQKANVFLFPDLDSGNIAYKIAQYLGGYEALGPIIQWLAKPGNDLSRGASSQDIIAMHHITKNQ